MPESDARSVSGRLTLRNKSSLHKHKETDCGCFKVFFVVVGFCLYQVSVVIFFFVLIFYQVFSLVIFCFVFDFFVVVVAYFL